MLRPPLAPLDSRIGSFELTMGTAAEFLRSAWPELRDVSFEVATMPSVALNADAEPTALPRWYVDSAARRIVLFRLPIERLARLHRNDELHRRMHIEGCVFRAAAEYLGRDPWDLAPDRFHF